MKWSTETLHQIKQIIVADFQKQLAQGELVCFSELEQEMRQTLQEIGQNSLGQMLSLQDEQDHGPQQRSQCQGLASRVSSAQRMR